eukprot:scaffold1307_cov200-Pinguiococcus_pyrenoidosus.AAC.62
MSIRHKDQAQFRITQWPAAVALVLILGLPFEVANIALSRTWFRASHLLLRQRKRSLLPVAGAEKRLPWSFLGSPDGSGRAICTRSCTRR